MDISNASVSFNQLLDESQEAKYFDLRYSKNKRINRHKANANFKKKTKIFLGPILGNLTTSLGSIEILPTDFISNLTSNFSEAEQHVANSIVILQNNDFSGVNQTAIEAYRKLYQQNENTVFAIWDTDNHHWFTLSSFLAMNSDFYYPAHPVAHDYYSKLTDHLTPGILSGSIQWSKSFLMERIDQILKKRSNNTLFGRHGFYPRFKARNTTLVSLNRQFKDVTLSTENYSQRSFEERFCEWTKYKYHLIAPVNFDLPYRLFDSLVTGGYPIVPLHYKQFLKELKHEENAIFYTTDELFNPDLLDKSINEFTRTHEYLTPKRQYAINKINLFHADYWLEKLLLSMYEILEYDLQ